MTTKRKIDLSEPAAWLHTLWMELGQCEVIVTEFEDSPFGVPGEDHSECYKVVSEPLYRKSIPKRPRIRV